MAILTITEVCEAFPMTQYFIDEDKRILFGLPIPEHPEMHFRFDTEKKLILLDFTIEEYIKVWKECIDAMQHDIPDSSDEDTQETSEEQTKEVITMATTEATEKPKKEYRTKAKAGAVSEIPSHLALPSTNDYLCALLPMDTDNPHITAVIPHTNLSFKNGTLYLNGLESSRINLYDYATKQGIEKIDLATLDVLYSIVYNELREDILLGMIDPTKDIKQIRQYAVTIRINDLHTAMGKKGQINQRDIDLIINKITQYQGILGVIPDPDRPKSSFPLPVLLYVDGDMTKNTVTFMAPYFSQIIATAIEKSIRKRKGTYLSGTNGRYETRASHAHSLHTSAAGNRNKPAYEIAKCVTVLIDRLGNKGAVKTPHLSAVQIIERCPSLKRRLENTGTKSEQTKFLKSAFLEAWRILREESDLPQKYKNLRIPDIYPTAGTLERIVFTFPHDGTNAEK